MSTREQYLDLLYAAQELSAWAAELRAAATAINLRLAQGDADGFDDLDIAEAARAEGALRRAHGEVATLFARSVFRAERLAEIHDLGGAPRHPEGTES